MFNCNRRRYELNVVQGHTLPKTSLNDSQSGDFDLNVLVSQKNSKTKNWKHYPRKIRLKQKKDLKQLSVNQANVYQVKA